MGDGPRLGGSQSERDQIYRDAIDEGQSPAAAAERVTEYDDSTHAGTETGTGIGTEGGTEGGNGPGIETGGDPGGSGIENA
jgi:hypothetical protein